MEDIDMVDIDALLTPKPLLAPLPMECDTLTDPAPAECCTPKRNPDKEDQESHTQNSTKVATNYLENAASFENHMFLVLDSCVYMNEIVSIMDIFRSEVPISKPQPILVVPYKVLQELELVKLKKHDLSPAITKVTKFLHSMLKVRDKRIKGQRPIDTHLELFEMSSPDDAILNCALQVKQVVGDKVVLVSEDRNLLTKALVADVKAYSWKEFCDRYDFDP
ncbi:transcriptional protein SWT1-like [Anopheles cruzii]|uniref:transcriptional protein SWT1-like n=1 Tax=Anopheles cruzii TaxID=68878 RepID=UPI0022EC4BAB|nr:transcriptional protein SWT1-like [Anopheles cruzii]